MQNVDLRSKTNNQYFVRNESVAARKKKLINYFFN